MASVEGEIDKRLEELNGQKEEIARRKDDPLGSSAAYQDWLAFLREGLRTGQFDLQDTFDTVLFLTKHIDKSNPEEIIQFISNGDVPIPESIRPALIQIATREVEEYRNRLNVWREKDEQLQERMQQDLPEEYQGTGQRINEFEMENIPSKKWKSATAYQTLQSWQAQQNAQLRDIEPKIADLESVKDTFEWVRILHSALELGQRSHDFLKTPEGQQIIEGLENFLQVSYRFIQRYAKPIIEEGHVNPMLMGRSGTIGNSIIAIHLMRMYNVIRENIKEFKTDLPPEIAIERIEPSESDIIVQDPESVSRPEASSSNKIKRMSELLWVAFEDRARLR